MMSRKPTYPSTIISPFASEADDSLWVPVPSNILHGAEPMMNFKNVAADDDQNGDADDYEGCRFSQTGGKKRRLSVHQVQFLERSFDLENKLEPERKSQLAKELGLQPRQVAIWFQNRRARFKTKQLEKEYGELKGSYDKLKAEFDSLIKENDQLKEQVQSLKDKLMNKGKGKEEQISSDKLGPDSSENISGSQKSIHALAEDLPDQKPTTSVSRSNGVINSGSPYLTDSNQQALLLEPANSSHAFEPDCSDFSQEECGNLNFPTLEHETYRGSCGLGFTPELDQQIWSWPY